MIGDMQSRQPAAAFAQLQNTWVSFHHFSNEIQLWVMAIPTLSAPMTEILAWRLVREGAMALEMGLKNAQYMLPSLGIEAEMLGLVSYLVESNVDLGSVTTATFPLEDELLRTCCLTPRG
ncbi:hypothetical protein ACFX15_029873 [Malus domestica]